MTAPYRLLYLSRDEREVAGLRPCHLCCFGGLRLECQQLCKRLGQDAYFIEGGENARSANNGRIRLAWQNTGLDPQVTLS